MRTERLKYIAFTEIELYCIPIIVKTLCQSLRSKKWKENINIALKLEI